MPQINGTSHGTARTNSTRAPQTTTPAEAEGTGAHSADRFDARVTNPFVPSVTAATVGEIDGFNHIKTIIPDAEVRFDRLPMSGRSEHEPWSGYYWPKNKGGISYRWKTGESHTYKSPSMVEVQTMPQSELAKLSPAEKYDLFVGSYNYPLNEAMKSGNKASTPSWQGYCHGWTAASMAFKEPRAVVLENPDGVKIPFSSSDIKALLTYFQGDVVQTTWGRTTHPFKVDVHTLGSVNGGGNARDIRAYDLNPGTFHAMLGNRVGKGQSFGIDCDNGREKWNQPVHAYNAELIEERAPSPGASPHAVKEMVMRTDVTYALEIEPHDRPVSETGHQSNRTEQYQYTVELDANGEIVGGQWLLESQGSRYTYHEVVDELERRGWTGGEIAGAMPQYMRFPDYAFMTDAGQFAEEFRPAPSVYAFISGDKRQLHSYFAKLSDIYEAATD